jgi:Protein of unknown function (DUF2946)
MSRLAPRPVFVEARLPGLLLAVIALAVQLAAASIVPWTAVPQTSLNRLVATSICHSDGVAADQDGMPSRHQSPDCAICPLCQAIAHADVLRSSVSAALLAPTLAVSRVAALPPARAPPTRRVAAAAPRGPPELT